MSKYKNKILKVGHLKFGSQKEYERYVQLSLLQSKGLISDLKMQVEFKLAKGVKFKYEKRAKPALKYIADFTYMQDGNLIVEDVKSKITKENPVYRIKKHLMMTVHGIEVIER